MGIHVVVAVDLFDGKAARLEHCTGLVVVKEAKIVAHDSKGDVVGLGTEVCIQKAGEKGDICYTIVGSEEANIQDNPLLEISKHILFHEFHEMKVERPSKFGGNVSYSEYSSLESDFAEKKLHPSDLKQIVTNYLIKIINPIRYKVKLNQELFNAIKKSY